MSALRSAPGALRLLALSVVARVAPAMLSIALLVHVADRTGSFAVAGAAAAAYALGVGAGGPLLGRLADRRGAIGVLLASAAVSGLLLEVIAMLPANAGALPPVALSAAIGLVVPPVGACLRSTLATLVPDRAALQTAYGVDAAASELTFIAGPPVALAVGALASTAAALAAAGALLLTATVAFALQPATRVRTPRPATAGTSHPSALATPAMRALAAVMGGVGVLFGAVEVAITAAAQAAGTTTAAAPLLALWGAGSLIGGLVVVRVGGALRGAAGLALVLAALAAGHLALAGATGSLPALGVLLLVAGAAIAPTYAIAYALVDDAAPAGTATEAFAWLATAVTVGAALGSAGAGAAVDHAGPGAAIVLGALGALGALAVALAQHRREADVACAAG
jgi:predicted MFS family arabinose efflux permease